MFKEVYKHSDKESKKECNKGKYNKCKYSEDKCKKDYNNTIFDDVFRTIVEKMPSLLLPILNEVFHTSYREDEKIEVLHNEHHDREGKVITDSCLLVCKKLYHIECQSWPDSTMAVRMIEYDFMIAFENAVKDDGVYTMEFPRSCTLYLRHTENTPDFLQVRLIIPEVGKSVNTSEQVNAKNHIITKEIVYKTPIIKVQDYTKDDVFRKNLIALLPYYIMRYEKELDEIEENSEKLNMLLDEYRSISGMLTESLDGDNKAVLYTDIVALIIRISDYLLSKKANTRKGVLKVLGGQILELESERIIRVTTEKEQRKAEAEKRILREKAEKEKLLILYGFVEKGKITVDEAATELGMSQTNFLEKVSKLVKEIK